MIVAQSDYGTLCFTGCQQTSTMLIVDQSVSDPTGLYIHYVINISNLRKTMTLNDVNNIFSRSANKKYQYLHNSQTVLCSCAGYPTGNGGKVSNI